MFASEITSAMVSTSVKRAVVSAAVNSVLIEILLYGKYEILYIHIYFPLIFVSLGIYSAFYAGTMYIYCENDNIISNFI